MPNWCCTSYAFYGDKATLNDFYAKLKLFTSKSRWDDRPVGKYEFGSNWLGNIVMGFGFNPNDVYCRGLITDFELCDDHVSVGTETAWSPMNEVWDAITNKYYRGNKLQYVYIAEELGCDFTVNTDVNGWFFDERILIDDGDGIYEYFSDEESALRWLNNEFGFSEKTLQDAVKKYNESHENLEINVHYFTTE